MTDERKEKIRSGIEALYASMEKPELAKKTANVANGFQDLLFENFPRSFVEKNMKGRELLDVVLSILSMISVHQLEILQKVYNLPRQEVLDLLWSRINLACELKDLKKEYPDIFKKDKDKK